MIETKGLSCLFFLEIQPLEKTVAYKALLIKQNKCSLKRKRSAPEKLKYFVKIPAEEYGLKLDRPASEKLKKFRQNSDRRKWFETQKARSGKV